MTTIAQDAARAFREGRREQITKLFMGLVGTPPSEDRMESLLRTYLRAEELRADVVESTERDAALAAEPAGLLMFSVWEMLGIGLGKHFRQLARCIRDSAGIPIRIRGHEGGLSEQGAWVDAAAMAEMRDLIEAEPRCHAVVSAFAFGSRYNVSVMLDHLERVSFGRPSIVCTVHELTAIDPVWAEPFSRASQVWLPCKANIEALRPGVPDGKLRLVPVPFLDGDARLALAGRERTPGRPHFCHIGVWEPRKAQHSIVGAFLMAMKPGQAQLTIKTGQIAITPGWPLPSESVPKWLEDERVRENGWTLELAAKDIVIVADRKWTDQQITDLHRSAHIYVTASHGEGFEMSARDAKLAGNRMIYTPSGGPQDFAGERDLLVPSTGTMPVDPLYHGKPWEYERGALSVAYDIADLVKAMRIAAADPQPHTHDLDLGPFTSAAVGRAVRSHLSELDSAW